jgi:hypothetical protein
VVEDLELWQLVLALREEAKKRAVARKKSKTLYKQPNPGQLYNLVWNLPVSVVGCNRLDGFLDI